MDEIRQHFADVTRKGKVIVARSPLTDGKTSAWFNDGFTAGPRLFQISRVWTGSAAYYDRPDSNFIGTGEGAQVYGWGLYGSSVRAIAEWYARKDAADKNRRATVVWDGTTYTEDDIQFLGRPTRTIMEKIIELQSVDAAEQFFRDKLQNDKNDLKKLEEKDGSGVAENGDSQFLDFFADPKGVLIKDIERMERVLDFFNEIKPQLEFRSGFAPFRLGKKEFRTTQELIDALGWKEKYGEAVEEAVDVLAELSSYEDLPPLEDRIKALKDHDTPEYQTAARILEDNPDFEIRRPRNLYDQTFWPDMEHNPLDWDEDIPREQIDAILDGLANSTGEVWKRVVRFINSERDDWLVDDETGEVEQPDEWADYPPDIARDYLDQFLDTYESPGSYVYRQLTQLLGSPKAASEFLYSVGIHGITYIGDSSNERNYVAFSDKDIRIDRHIMFQGGARVSQTETPEFQEWFGGSEAVDDKGAPLMVYHDTSSVFSEFSREKIGTATDPGMLGSGFYFSSDGNSPVRPGQRRMAVYLSVKHPLVVKMDQWGQNKSGLVLAALGSEASEGESQEELTKRIDRLLDKGGYDGVVVDYSPVGYRHKEFMVRSPEQIKQAETSTDDAIPPKVLKLINQFKAELEGTTLNEEQAGIFDVITRKKNKTVIRVNDLDALREYVLLKGSRGKGAHKILTVHYAGIKGKVTANEIINIGAVIRHGKYEPGDSLHPTSHSYTMAAEDGARLRVVIDFDKKRNESVINFYSNRKTENRAHQASSGITDSPDTINGQPGNVKPGSQNNPKTTPQIIGEKGNDKSYKTYEPHTPQSELHRGATTFSGDWNATITLFEGAADASTLIHELGHYTFETMRKLVERGLADERMTDDWNKLLAFIGAKPGEELSAEQNEKLARAFEAYTMEGRAPSVELEGAFATLRYLLTQIYKSVKALGVKLNDEVRAVFDGMLATDEAADAASVINEAAREINAELLGLSQSEVKTYRELIEKANRQTVQELTARKNKELEELRPQWRKEAADQMAADPVYKAWKEAQGDPLDFTDVVNLTDEQTAYLLRSRGLVSAPGKKTEAKIDEKTGDLLKPAGYYNAKPGVHPAEVAMKHGFDSAEEMLRSLASALTPADYVGAYMAEQEAAFHAQFKASEAALTAQASIDALEKLSELLAVKGGMAGYRVRREMFKRRALDEINSTPVSQIVSDSELIGSCRRSARELTAAVNGSDFKTAFEMAQKLRFNLEVLRHKAAARKVVSQTENLLKKARHAKKGVIYGDHQDALLDLSVRFGFTRPGKAYTHTVASVIREYNEQAAEEGYAPLDVPEWLLNGNIPYGGMPFGED